MSIDRVATAPQTAYFLAQIENAGNALNTTQQQIASGVNATTYAGFGNQTQVLTATCPPTRATAPTPPPPISPPPRSTLQDTQLTSLSSLATQLQRRSVTRSPTITLPTLMTEAQSIFSQASSILNSKDANGNYILQRRQYKHRAGFRDLAFQSGIPAVGGQCFHQWNVQEIGAGG